MGKGWMKWTMFSEVSEVTCLCIGLCCSKFLSFIRIIWHSGFHFWSFKFYARMRKALNVADLEDRCTFGSTTHMHEGVMIFDERGYFRLNRSENFPWLTPSPMFYQKYFRTDFVSPRGVCYSSGLCFALENFQPRKALQSLFSEMQMWPMRSSGLNDIPCTVFNQ